MKILDTLLLGDEENFKAIGSIQRPDSAGDDEEDSIVATVSYLPETPFQVMKYLGRQIGFLKVLAASPDMATSTGVKVGLRLERIEKLSFQWFPPSVRSNRSGRWPGVDPQATIGSASIVSNAWIWAG